MLAALAFGALACWAQAPDVGAESAEGERSAEAAPEAVEDAAEDAPAEESEDEPEEQDSSEDGPAEVFVPTENISEDISVPFPVDI